MLKPVEYLEDLIKRRPDIQVCRDDIWQAYKLMVKSLDAGGKLIICGNGGSASDALHMVGELLKGFENKRLLPEEQKNKFTKIHSHYGSFLAEKLQRPIRAIELVSSAGILTAVVNDTHADLMFAQQLFGLAEPRDLFVGISTSGNSMNVVYAMITAKALGMHTVGLLGRQGGKMREFCDVAIVAPGENTPLIQENHLPIYHVLCLMLESHYFA